ncbi:MAG TPA: MupA/Atu3671 family FMN-dependent luciferase-like monooxygenase [Opitutaceae bacterium]|nr:MupA/Atu3671 family FMN-dependent luciferase-like monooxygenase [Opitutaceae bacterium]
MDTRSIFLPEASGDGAAARATAVPEADLIPASSSQRRLWFLDQMEPGSPLYNIPYLVRLRGPLDARALEKALHAIIERHEVLRTNFTAVGSEPMQFVRPAWTLDVPTTDLSSTAVGEREAELRRSTSEEARKPFNLSTDLMLRVRLYRLATNEHALMLVMHHIASDGWSMGILYRELGSAYEAFTQDRRPALPELPVQYADFAQWQHEYLQGDALKRLVDFWRKSMAGAPAVLELPADRPRPPVQSHRGGNVRLNVPAALIARLREVSQQHHVTLFMTLLAGFKILVHRYTGQTDVVIGSPLAGRDAAETEALIGCFINTLALRTNLSGDPTVTELLGRIRDVTLTAYEYRELPYEKLVEELQPQRNLSFDPICQVFFMLQNVPTAPLKLAGIELSVEPVYTETAKSDLTIWTIEHAGGLDVTAEYNRDIFEAATIERMMGHYVTVLAGIAERPGQRISQLPLLTTAERRQVFGEWNATQLEYARTDTIVDQFAAQVKRRAADPALVFEDRELTYGELDARAERLAAELRKHGAGPDVPIAICLERSLDMLVGLLGILKAGAAYVPLDPTYPKERLGFMLQDSRAPVVVTELGMLSRLPRHEAAVVCVDGVGKGEETSAAAATAGNGQRSTGPENLAYVLYTSGSTGNPKGVMVTHRNVVNFFAGMDRVLGSEPGVWLALTSISFDISVLELFWTLTRGFKVVLLSDAARMPGSTPERRRPERRPLDFSLFYFGNETEATDGDRYRLTIEGAKFADRHGFQAVWTPERHFHAFGGLYPNPAVMAAAIATVTERIQIRAGSVVLPLHHPLRVAEEWAVVDNLSRGRVGVSIASGWHDRDFTLAPEYFADRKGVMTRGIETLRRLWSGEAVEYAGGRGRPFAVKVYPRPVQHDLPLWVTAAGNPETFRLAGEIGANVLTHFLGQEPDDLARKIKVYREARRAAGHAGEGCVSIALHTFVGENLDEVRATVHDPLCRYLRESVELLRDLSQGLYPGADVKQLSEEEMQAVVEHSFNRYFAACGLLGTPETCRKTLEKLAAIGVDDIACLIDFGVDVDATLKSLALLDGVRGEWQAKAGGSRLEASRSEVPAEDFSLAGQIRRHGVTHLQCTPSFARMLGQNAESTEALRHVRKLMVGGEALPTGLARELREKVGGEVINMYGPTETTIWSSTHRVIDETSNTGAVAIGRPIANTQMYILDSNRQAVPVGVPGELWIAGDGVARGYFQRPELTAERFVPDPFAVALAAQATAGEADRPARMYRTGDLARWRADGVIDFLGRVDFQVKIRGHRIELGEIEAALMQHSDVRQAVVALRQDAADDPRLVAYVVVNGDAAPATNAWRDFLKQKLPDYMVPSAYVVLEQLPLTPNGKVDRKALPAPQGSAGAAAREFVAPAGGAEQALAAIWRDILRVGEIGVDDNFFDYGGHSLQVVQMQNRIRESLQIDIPVLKLFQYPTIRSLAKYIGESDAAEPSLRDKMEERNRRRQAVITPRRRATATVERP